MKCPWCVSEGQTSTISVGSLPVTLMFTHSYYDEDGNAHFHNPNGEGSYLECSRGHGFAPETKGCQSCDFGHEPAKLLYLHDERVNPPQDFVAPRPIQVGDLVEFEWDLGNYRAVVLAIDGKIAWLGYDTLQRPITKELSAVAAVVSYPSTEEPKP